MLELGVKFLLSYFIGSILGSSLMGKIYGGVDIRTMGSGNAGGTNALRTQGWTFALGVIIVDVGKCAISDGLIPGMNIPFIPEDPEVSRTGMIFCCAIASVMGHVWPMWYQFQGGKGAATLIGTLLVLSPAMILPLLLVWIIVLVVFGFVGLATICAGLFTPIYLLITQSSFDGPLFAYCISIALYLIYTHRSNIHRMKEGTEHKNEKMMIFHRKKHD